MNDTDEPITVLIVDDHRDVRAALARIVVDTEDLHLVGFGCDGLEAIDATVRLRPDVVLMDVRMPGMDGIEATSRILAERKETKIIALTAADDPEHVRAAFVAGAVGYLVKDSAPRDIVAAIRHAMAGQATLDLRITDAFTQRATR